MGVQMVPGGRYVIGHAADRILLWDLGCSGPQTPACGGTLLNVSHVECEAFFVSNLSQASENSFRFATMERYIRDDGQPWGRYRVYQVGPLPNDPRIQVLAEHRATSSNSEMPSRFWMAGARVFLYRRHTGVLDLWSYVDRTMSSVVVPEGKLEDTPEFLNLADAVVVLREKGLHVVPLPKLQPKESSSLGAGPPEEAAHTPSYSSPYEAGKEEQWLLQAGQENERRNRGMAPLSATFLTYLLPSKWRTVATGASPTFDIITYCFRPMLLRRLLLNLSEDLGNVHAEELSASGLSLESLTTGPDGRTYSYSTGGDNIYVLGSVTRSGVFLHYSLLGEGNKDGEKWTAVNLSVDVKRLAPVTLSHVTTFFASTPHAACSPSAMATLFDLPTELILRIIRSVEPSDILKMSQVCKQALNILSDRAVWEEAVRRVFARDSIFEPSFEPLPSMDLVDLRKAALRPELFHARVSKDTNLLFCRDRVLDDTAMFLQAYLIPGGRYVVGMASTRVCLYDAGAPGSKQEEVALLHTVDFGYDHALSLMSPPAQVSNNTFRFAVVSLPLMQVFEVGPLPGLPVFRCIASTPTTAFTGYISDIWVTGNRVLLLQAFPPTFAVWDFVDSALVSWVIADDIGYSYCNAFTFNGCDTIIALRGDELWGWKLPDLQPFNTTTAGANMIINPPYCKKQYRAAPKNASPTNIPLIFDIVDQLSSGSLTLQRFSLGVPEDGADVQADLLSTSNHPLQPIMGQYSRPYSANGNRLYVMAGSSLYWSNRSEEGSDGDEKWKAVGCAADCGLDVASLCPYSGRLRTPKPCSFAIHSLGSPAIKYLIQRNPRRDYAIVHPRVLVCQSLLNILADRAIWEETVRGIYAQNSLFEPTFKPLPSMDLDALRKAALRPGLFHSRVSKAAGSVSPCRERILENTAGFLQAYIIPGGRYIIGMASNRVCLYDAGKPGSTQNVTLLNMMHLGRDNSVVLMSPPSQSSIDTFRFAVVARPLVHIFEVGPLPSHTAIRRLASVHTTAFNGYTFNIWVAGNRLLLLQRIPSWPCRVGFHRFYPGLLAHR
ncbi:hypothetical protein NMY22_g18724 [Coprinellus aureogranulatus]|nr:hypothetical protein NMY22_g18724 [Coprinellus aureogranulatus]